MIEQTFHNLLLVQNITYRIYQVKVLCYLVGAPTIFFRSLLLHSVSPLKVMYHSQYNSRLTCLNVLPHSDLKSLVCKNKIFQYYLTFLKSLPKTNVSEGNTCKVRQKVRTASTHDLASPEN
jgi:hypothetical protein